ncbi:MAG: MetQ/NlpA family ABC transporter substrate-binding protein [Peptostreptococcaceae bacterium]
MKLKKIASLALCAVVSLGIVGCSSTKEKSEDNKIIKIGATLVPGGELLEELKPLIEEKGYKLDVTIFNDYIMPNEALNNKEIDANLFQHKPYLDEAVKTKGYEIMAGSKLYVCPGVLYSKKIKSIDEFKKGDTIAISNNPSAGSKCLRYLEALGLIKLNEGDLVGVKDIIDNPKGIEFVELDVAQIAPSLEDVTAGFIDTTYAIPAGLSADDDGIYTAPINDEYANLLAYRIQDKESEKIKVLEEVLTSDECRELIKSKYKGIVIPVF